MKTTTITSWANHNNKKHAKQQAPSCWSKWRNEANWKPAAAAATADVVENVKPQVCKYMRRFWSTHTQRRAHKCHILVWQRSKKTRFSFNLFFFFCALLFCFCLLPPTSIRWQIWICGNLYNTWVAHTTHIHTHKHTAHMFTCASVCLLASNELKGANFYTFFSPF